MAKCHCILESQTYCHKYTEIHFLPVHESCTRALLSDTKYLILDLLILQVWCLYAVPLENYSVVNISNQYFSKY